MSNQLRDTFKDRILEEPFWIISPKVFIDYPLVHISIYLSCILVNLDHSFSFQNQSKMSMNLARLLGRLAVSRSKLAQPCQNGWTKYVRFWTVILLQSHLNGAKESGEKKMCLFPFYQKCHLSFCDFFLQCVGEWLSICFT